MKNITVTSGVLSRVIQNEFKLTHDGSPSRILLAGNPAVIHAFAADIALERGSDELPHAFARGAFGPGVDDPENIS